MDTRATDNTNREPHIGLTKKIVAQAATFTKDENPTLIIGKVKLQELLPYSKYELKNIRSFQGIPVIINKVKHNMCEVVCGRK